MIDDNKYKIECTTYEYKRDYPTKKYWRHANTEGPREISSEKYQNMITATEWFRGKFRSGYERAYWNDTCTGNRVTRLVSISPDRRQKIEWCFRIEYRKEQQ